MHRMAAAACLTAGVWLLLGPGWALLALGGLLWVSAPRGRGITVRWQDVRTHAARVGRRIAAMPRRVVAVSTMAAGVAAVPSGILLVFGAGAAIVTAGALLAGVSLLAGWNA